MVGDGREYGADSSSPMVSPSSAAMASSVAEESAADPSPLLFGRFLSGKSSLPEPTLAMAEPAPRLGTKRSAPYVSVVFAFPRGAFLDLALEGVLVCWPVQSG